jgi:guanylate kinase
MAGTGTLFIVAAPSGAGKTSLVHGLLDSLPGIEISVSHTTRAPRPGEMHGRDYFFVQPAEFDALVARSMFLEHARVFDHQYGTSRETVLARLEADIDVILEIDWQGARQVRSQFPDCQSIFILPPSLQVLRERLVRRGQDDPAVIERRMRDAVSEMRHYDEFDYLIVNDDFTASLEALRAIFIARRQRCTRQRERQQGLLRSLLS